SRRLRSPRTPEDRGPTTTIPTARASAAAGAAGAGGADTGRGTVARTHDPDAGPPGGTDAPEPTRLAGDLVDDLVDAGSRGHYVDAPLYDYEYRRRRADVTFYRELARRRGADRILELGAGSGRVTVPLARDGHYIVAVERSPAMLARLRGRIARLPAAAAAR